MLNYLATPYTKYPHGIEAAFREAASLAGALLQIRCVVYSPIVHCHPIASFSSIDPLDHSIWLKFNEHMMRACDALIVAKMVGWDESYGIKHEIDFFSAAGKPINYLNCQTLLFERD